MTKIVDEAAEGGIKYLVCANSPTSTIAEINATIKVYKTQPVPPLKRQVYNSLTITTIWNSTR